MIYCIADTHFGHKMLKEKGLRVENSEEVIIHNWNSIVKPTDTVIHLGDFCLGRFPGSTIDNKLWSLSESTLLWRNKLNGSIILVKGNHDKAPCPWFMDNGFVFCCDQFEMKYKGKQLLFTHEPIANNDQKINIHGHIHSTLRKEELGFDINNKFYRNVAVDHISFRPILLNVLI